MGCFIPDFVFICLPCERRYCRNCCFMVTIYFLNSCVKIVNFRMPLLTLILHAMMGLIYDLDSPDPDRNRFLVIMEAIIWNILIQGCLQPITALFVAFFVCPFICLVILGGKLPLISVLQSK